MFNWLTNLFAPKKSSTVYPSATAPTVAPYTGPNPTTDALLASTLGNDLSTNPNPRPDVAGASTSRPAPADPNGNAPAAPVYPDRTNSINMNNAALSQVDAQREGGLSAVRSALSRLLGGYDAESKANESNYTTQTETNRNNQQGGLQAALLGAANGRRGLFGTLSSIGALNGSGIDLANRAVQQAANADIAGANNTFSENQTSLDTNIGQYRAADERRRQEGQQAATESEGDINNQALINRQKLLAQLADDYAAMGNADRSRQYSEQASSLFPDIARSSVPTPNLSPIAAAFTPSTLANYIAGGGTQIATTPAAGANQLPGLVALPTDRRRREGQ